jgi:hypothetical protein
MVLHAGESNALAPGYRAISLGRRFVCLDSRLAAIETRGLARRQSAGIHSLLDAIGLDRLALDDCAHTGAATKISSDSATVTGLRFMIPSWFEWARAHPAENGRDLRGVDRVM